MARMRVWLCGVASGLDNQVLAPIGVLSTHHAALVASSMELRGTPGERGCVKGCWVLKGKGDAG